MLPSDPLRTSFVDFLFLKKNNYRIILYAYHYFYCSFFLRRRWGFKAEPFSRDCTETALPPPPPLSPVNGTGSKKIIHAQIHVIRLRS